MTVDDALLTRLEKLSYVKIADDKREEVIGQLSEILTFVDNLAELDTEGVDDVFAMTDKGTYARPDEAACDAQINQDILEHAPQSEENFFIVPKIIE
jgi:aspartyl-tRNA(Asn)/glutamyl-tRNA(Gln) amidotransferase subunit C